MKFTPKIVPCKKYLGLRDKSGRVIVDKWAVSLLLVFVTALLEWVSEYAVRAYTTPYSAVTY